MEGWRRREEEKMEGEEEEKYDVDNFGADGGPLSVRGRCARGAQHGTSEGGKAWGPVKAAFRSRSAAQDPRDFSCSRARSSSFLVLKGQILEFSCAPRQDPRVFSCSRARFSSFPELQG